MRSYTIHFDLLGATIWDDRGHQCSLDQCEEIVMQLMESFLPGAFVYIGKKEGSRYKIGMTTDLRQRSGQLGIDFIHIIPCATWAQAHKIEQAMHQFFAPSRVWREWFDLEISEVNRIKSWRSSGEALHTTLYAYKPKAGITQALWRLVERVRAETDSLTQSQSGYREEETQ